jgi:nitroimidazol reductase NimA-like FMN-containing flavoprotein (pyridoxamine 5'-phosphate oxidase superfamily)
MTNEYSVSKLNKARQQREYAKYDRDTVHAVLDSAPYASVGFIQDGQPVVVPMIHGREGETIFLHGARKARVIRLLEQTEQACLNVTHIDGLVFARSAFNSSMSYRSATIFGPARLVDDYDEKVHAMRVISEHIMPGRWNELREPLQKEVKMTGVIAIDIASASAKISNDMPDDEDEDYAIPIWAGVLPLQSSYQTLIDDERLSEGIEPSAVVKALEGKIL